MPRIVDLFRFCSDISLDEPFSSSKSVSNDTVRSEFDSRMAVMASGENFFDLLVVEYVLNLKHYYYCPPCNEYHTNSIVKQNSITPVKTMSTTLSKRVERACWVILVVLRCPPFHLYSGHFNLEQPSRRSCIAGDTWYIARQDLRLDTPTRSFTEVNGEAAHATGKQDRERGETS